MSFKQAGRMTGLPIIDLDWSRRAIKTFLKGIPLRTEHPSLSLSLSTIGYCSVAPTSSKTGWNQN